VYLSIYIPCLFISQCTQLMHYFFVCSIFNGLPDTFEVARYHSLYGLSDKLPSCLDITALTEDGIAMGIKHKTLPYAAVQFHPESILTSPVHGMTILKNALSFLLYESEVNVIS
jgi:anthranilate synthase